MAFCGDREDAISMSLTVLRQLMERHSVSPQEIGRLEVGTESSLDHSKGIKTYLMNLFEDSGNTDIEVGTRAGGEGLREILPLWRGPVPNRPGRRRRASV